MKTSSGLSVIFEILTLEERLRGAFGIGTIGSEGGFFTRQVT